MANEELDEQETVETIEEETETTEEAGAGLFTGGACAAGGGEEKIARGSWA